MLVARILLRLFLGIGRGAIHRWPTTLLTLLVLGASGLVISSQSLIPGLPRWEGFGGTGSSTPGDAREMTIEDLRPVRGGEHINLVLKEKAGNRRLVMAVGQAEALAIASDLNNRRSDYPVTYDLMRSIVKELGGTVNRVVVNNANDTTFFAKVIMSAENRQIEVDSRPSDAIALALRSRAPIFADATVLDKYGVLSPN